MNELTPYERRFINAALNGLIQLAGFFLAIEVVERRKQTWIDIIDHCDTILKKI